MKVALGRDSLNVRKELLVLLKMDNESDIHVAENSMKEKLCKVLDAIPILMDFK